MDELEQTPGDTEGQGSLVCYSPWGHEQVDATEQQQVLVSTVGPSQSGCICSGPTERSWDLWKMLAEGKNSYHISLLDLCLRMCWKWACESPFRFLKLRWAGENTRVNWLLGYSNSGRDLWWVHLFSMDPFPPQRWSLFSFLSFVSFVVRKKTTEWNTGVGPVSLSLKAASRAGEFRVIIRPAST